MPTIINGVQIGTKLSVNFMTNMQKLHRGIWPWTVGLKSRLPLHYKRRYVEKFMRDPVAVHYRFDARKFVANEEGMPVRVQNVPVPVLFPREAEAGLWGGEGIVSGFKKRNNNPQKPSSATIWKPHLRMRIFYSEILDRFMSITVTRSTLDLVDAACGFDSYILGTPEIDMQSRLGMTLKREMLLALANKSLHPSDPVKHDEVFKKYAQYVIPTEEAEWVGLSLYEAERKQLELEEGERLRNLRPLKEIYAAKLARELENKLLEDGSDNGPKPKTWLEKFNPFQDKKTS